jgi:2,4-diketo-3-deoxy-L-fuconate hydrolase
MQQFARVQQGNSVIPALVSGDGHLDLRPLVSDITPDTIGSGVLAQVNVAVLKPIAGDVTYLAPIQGIRQIPATGFNYKKHIEEMKVPTPTEPEVFLKSMLSLTGPFDPISRGPNTGVELDWKPNLPLLSGASCRTLRQRKLLATSSARFASTMSPIGQLRWMRRNSSTLCVQSRVRRTVRSAPI